MSFLVSQHQDKIESMVKGLTFGHSPDTLYEPVRYMMQLGGKRLRPMLALMGAYLFAEEYEKSLPSALSVAQAVEVFHNFTLMHDDIMDKAPIRRGMPTVHEKWNANTAILSGDVMLVGAYRLIGQLPPTLLPEALRLFNDCAAQVCEGQQLDMDFETASHVTEAEYIRMITLKTAVLLGYSLQLGALTGSAVPAQAQALYEFGVQTGIGFQLMDDLLDVFGDHQKVGKQVGGDIVANKKTYLLIKALQLATGEQAKQLDYWLSIQQFEKEEKVAAVTRIYEQLGVKQITEQLMNQYFDQAHQLLEQLPVPAHRKHVLAEFSRQLAKRDK